VQLLLNLVLSFEFKFPTTKWRGEGIKKSGGRVIDIFWNHTFISNMQVSTLRLMCGGHEPVLKLLS